jgi:Family of unknown function (DUF6062)
VTTWLRQGLRGGICPLCRVAHKADREYMWHFFDEGSDQGAAIDGLRAACGFCAEHIEMLRRIEVDGMRSTLGVSTTFADVFEGIVEDLDRLTPTGSFAAAVCPACANRDRQLAANTRNLLDLMATSPGHRDAFAASPGLCFPHFERAWNAAETAADRELLLAVQRRAAGSLLADLREHVRKQDERFRHEPKGSERDAWRRAIYLTAGWPPPTASAAEPEAQA